MATVSSPLSGRVISLLAIPDPVFSGAMVGPGTALDPDRAPATAVSPINGKVVSLHAHAYVVVDEQGHGVLTHLGLGTVQLSGEGFALLVEEGDIVRRGDGIVRWNPVAVEAAGASPICPVIALSATADALSGIRVGRRVTVGDPLFRWR